MAAGLPLAGQNGGSPPIRQYEVAVTSFSLIIEPAEQHIPAGLPARVATRLVYSDAASPYAPALLDYIRQHYLVRAEVEDPSDLLDGTGPLECDPGDDLLVPATAAPGDLILRNIRLVSKLDGSDFLYSRPESAIIHTGSQLFLSSVTATPMTTAELEAAGLLDDPAALASYQFTIGLEINGQPVTYAFPGTAGNLPALPAPQLPEPEYIPSPRLKKHRQDWPACAIQETRVRIIHPPVQLPEFHSSIPGLILIPGQVGFLKQHFQVILILCNALPPGTPYVLTGLQARLELPDPAALTLAAVPGQPDPTLQELSGGAGGNELAPGETGQAQWTLVGQQPGYHEFPVAIRGQLRAESNGALYELEGEVRGGVSVRNNPRFSISFIHPEQVEKGEEYRLTARITNVSDAPVQGFSISLEPRSLSGVTLTGTEFPPDYQFTPGAPVFRQNELNPGDTVNLHFILQSKLSGKVVATYLGEDVPGLEVGLSLVFGVDRDGQPMNPDTLILPRSIEQLDPAGRTGALYRAALDFAGLCHVLNRQPAASANTLYLPVRSPSVYSLINALAEGGLSVLTGLPREQAAALLLADLAGLAATDPGLALVLEVSPSGREFLRQLVLQMAGPGNPVSTLAATLANYAGPAAQPALVTASGLQPSASDTAISLTGTDGKLYVIPPDDTRTGFTLTGSQPGSVTLYLPAGPGRYQAWLYQIEGPAGRPFSLRLPAAALAGASRTAELVWLTGYTRSNLEPSAGASVSLQPARLYGPLKITPELLDAADPFGRNVIWASNRPLALPDAGNLATVVTFPEEQNECIFLKTVYTGRVLFAALNRPAGKFIPPVIRLRGLLTADGTRLPELSASVNICNLQSPYEKGVRVEGRVRYASGEAVASPWISLYIHIYTPSGRRPALISRFRGDAGGNFHFNFVPDNQLGAYLEAVEPVQLTKRIYPLTIHQDGQLLKPEIILWGTGEVLGEVVSATGNPVGNVSSVILRCAGDGRNLYPQRDGQGRFSASGVAVGAVDIDVKLSNNIRLRGATYLSRAGDTARVRLVTGGAGVRGRVTGLDGSWYGDCRVVLRAGSVEYPDVTFEDGTFQFANVPPGPFTVCATHPTRPQFCCVQDRVEDGTVRTVELVFDAGGVIHGQVLDRQGNRIPNCIIHLDREDAWDPFKFNLESDSGGEFEFSDLPAGMYTIRATRDGVIKEAEARALVVAGQQTDVTIVAEGPLPFQGWITEADGSVPVNPFLRIGMTVWPVAADGRFQGALPPGVYSYIAASDAGRNSGMFRIDNGNNLFAIRLRRQGTIAGRVVDSSGRGLQVQLALDAMNFLEGADYTQAAGADSSHIYYHHNLRLLMSNADGGFSFSRIWEGPFRIHHGGSVFYHPAVLSGQLGLADITGLTLVLPDATVDHTITGLLLRRDGVTPAAGLTVQLKNRGGFIWEAVTDAAGRFAFTEALRKGFYILSAEEPFSEDRAYQEIDFPGTADMDLTVAMLGRNTLRVQVFTAEGQALDQAWLEVVRQGEPSARREVWSAWETGFAGVPGEPPVYEFPGLYAGQYAVRTRLVSGETVLEASGGVELAGNDGVFTLSLVLAPAVNLHGTVRALGLTGSLEPLPGAEVSLVDPDGRLIALAATGSELPGQGEYELPAVAAGRYTLQAVDYATGRRAVQEVDLTGLTGLEMTADLELVELGRLEGRVEFSGNPPPGGPSLAGLKVLVSIRPQAESPYEFRQIHTVTGEDGSFLLEGLPAGRAEIKATKPPDRSGAAQTVIEPGATASVIITLSQTWDFSGRILQYQSNLGAPFARVELRLPDGTVPYRTTAGSGGDFQLDLVRAGTYTISAFSGTGLNRASATVTIPGQTYLELELGGLASLQGKVTRFSGLTAVPLAEVRFHHNASGRQLQAYADAAGFFNFPELPAGLCRITVLDGATSLRGEIASLDLPAGQSTEDLDLRLEPSFHLHGSVRSDGGQLLAGAICTFEAQRTDGSGVIRSAPTGDSGVYLMEYIPRLSGKLTVSDGVYGRRVIPLDPAGLPDEDWMTLHLTLDRTPPSVTAFSAAGPAGAYPLEAAGLDAWLDITFSEPLDATWLNSHTGWIQLQRLDGAAWRPVPVQPLAGGGPSFRLIPAALLEDSSQYLILIDSSVPDVNGNPLGSVFSATFQTVDLTPPRITAASPGDGAIQVPAGGSIQLEFSEPVQTASGQIAGQANGQPLDFGLQWSDGRRRLTLTPAGGLASDWSCLITVTGFLDDAGNRQSPDFSLAFDTADTIPPAVTGLFCGQTFSAGRPQLQFQYSDNLRGIDRNSALLTLSAPGLPAQPVEIINLSTSGLIFRPQDELPDLTWTSRLEIADRVGNSTVSECSFEIKRPEITILEHAPAAPVVVDQETALVQVRFYSRYPVGSWSLLIDGIQPPGAVLTADGTDLIASALLEFSQDRTVNVRFRVKDDQNFAAPEYSFSFIWDNLPPAIDFNVNGPPCDLRPVLAASFADGGTGPDPAGLHIRLDGEDVTGQFTINGFSASWQPPAGRPLTPGDHQLQMEIPDGAAHNRTSSIGFRLDNQPPVISIYTPLNRITTDLIPFDLEFNDPCGLDPESVSVRINGQPRSEFILSGNRIQIELPWDHEMFCTGDNLLEVTAGDTPGNRRTAGRIFTIDRSVGLPANLSDGNGYASVITGDAQFKWNPLVSTVWPVLAASRVQVDGTWYQLTPRTGAGAAENLREVRLREELGDPARLWEKRILVPEGGYFARSADWLENSTPGPLAVRLEQEFEWPAALSQPVFVTSSGGASPAPGGTDRWFILDDATDLDDTVQSNTPAFGILFTDESGLAPDEAEFTGERVILRWNSLTVPAAGDFGPGRLAILTALTAQPTRAAAQAALERLAARPAELYQGLLPALWPDVANLDLTAGPDSALPPLPALLPPNEKVEFRLRDATPEANPLSVPDLLLRSTHPLYNRFRVTFRGGLPLTYFYQSWTGRPLPCGEVEAWARLGSCYLEKAGQFELPAGAPPPSGLIFTLPGTGALQVTARLASGEGLPDIPLQLEPSGGGCRFNTFTGGNPAGQALLAGIPAGTYQLTAPGTAAQTVEISAGQTSSLELTIQQPNIVVEIRTPDNSAPLSGVTVYIGKENDHSTVLFQAMTGVDGKVVFLNPPVQETRNYFAVFYREDGYGGFLRNLTVPAGNSLALSVRSARPGSLTVRTETPEGQPLAESQAAVIWPSFPFFRLERTTGTDGRAFFPLPSTSISPAYPSLGLALAVQLPGQPAFPVQAFELETGEGREWLFTGQGANVSITGLLRTAGGHPAPGIRIYLERELRPGSFEYLELTDTGHAAEAGRFYFPAFFFSNGRGRIEVRRPASQDGGSEWHSFDLSLSGGNPLDLASGITELTGTVQLWPGETPATSYLTITAQSPEISAPDSRVESDGSFAIFGLQPGVQYNLSIRDGSGHSYCGTGGLPAGQPAGSGAALTSCDPLTVSGMVYAADGITPLPSGILILETETVPDQFTYAKQTSLSLQPFRFTSVFLPAGRGRLRLARYASQGGEDMLIFTASQTTGLEFVTGTTLVQCQAFDGNGQPVTSTDGWFARSRVETGQPYGANTIRQGLLTLFGVPPGEEIYYGIRDRNNRWYHQAATVDPAAGYLTGLRLSPVPESLQVLVLAADGLTPVPGLTVQMAAETSPGHYSSSGPALPADPEGRCTFTGFNLLLGRAQLTAFRAPDESSGQMVIDLVQSASYTFTSNLSVITGRVVDDQGQTVTGLEDFSLTALDGGDAWSFVEQDGLFQILGARPGVTYQIRATGSAIHYYCGLVRLEPEQMVLNDVEIGPCQTTSITGRLLALDGLTPAFGCQIGVFIETASLDWIMAGSITSDDNGEFSLGAYLPTGRVRLDLSPLESQGTLCPETRELAGQPGEPLNVEWVTSINSVSGSSQNEAGQPDLDYWIEVFPAGSAGPLPANQTLVDLEGRWTVLGVSPALPYSVTGRDYDGVPFRCGSFTLPAGEVTQAGNVLQPCQFDEVSGTLFAAGGNFPAVDIRLVLEVEEPGGSHRPAAECQTGIDGAFRFPPVHFPAGRARLTAIHPPEQDQAADIFSLLAGQTAGLSLTSSVTVLEGWLETDSGQRIENYDPLTVYPLSPGQPVLTENQEAAGPFFRHPDGSFRIQGLPPGISYELIAQLPDSILFQCARATVGGGGATGPVILRPCQPASVYGQVDAAGVHTALPGIQVSLRREISPGVYEHFATDSTFTSDSKLAAPLGNLHGRFYFRVPLATPRIQLAVTPPASQGEGEEIFNFELTLPSPGSLTLATGITVATGSLPAGSFANHLTSLSVECYTPGVPPVEPEQLVFDGSDFQITGLSPGRSYLVRATAVYSDSPEYHYQTFFTFPAGQRVLTGLTLEPAETAAAVTVSGTLYAAGGTIPWPEAGLVLEQEFNGVWRAVATGTTDWDGVFSLSAVCSPGLPARLVLQLPLSQGGGRELVPLASLPAEGLSLTAGVTVVRGRVATEPGLPLPLGCLALWAAPRGEVRPAPLVLLDDNSFTILGLEPGLPWDLIARDGLTGFWQAEVTLSPAEMIREGVELLPAGPATATVEVRLRDENGQARSGEEMYLIYQDRIWLLRLTDAAGAAVWEDLPAGVYGLSLDPYEWMARLSVTGGPEPLVFLWQPSPPSPAAGPPPGASRTPERRRP